MWRVRFVTATILLFLSLIILRLFYWQVVVSEKLIVAAEQQHFLTTEIPALRGEFLASDGFPFVSNQPAYLVYAMLPDVDKISLPFEKLSSLLAVTEATLSSRLSADLVWVPLKRKVEDEVKKQIETMDISGIGFERDDRRFYPEGSMAAHLFGFVGSDINGKDTGYFGLEGYYDGYIKGIPGKVRQEKDALGRPILVGEYRPEEAQDGSSLLLTLDRTVQFLVEKKLREGIEKYRAKAGSVIVMNPTTGAILAMASVPSYEPNRWDEYPKDLYKNPIVANSYEPGSTFKVLIMAAALNEKKVEPETRCDICTGPVQVSGYQIRTWNNKYFPNSTMTEVLQHSDNVGMVFVGQKIGEKKLHSYLKNFGIGEKTGIDLEEETTPTLRSWEEWKEIDLATTSFGQGVAVTPIQMIRAVSAIGNDGKLMKPYLVKKIISKSDEVTIESKVVRQVVKPETAKILTEMMINAVDNGEARFAKPKGYRIAGKTGTAQIPLGGTYQDDKTIASFVGFAPADHPKFSMLVVLTEPSSSPWGSETAAPLFFSIAKELFQYYTIAPTL
ncbi:MAG TPA: penicillin-binding protein 2 [Patescibacteria group bacterium]|nr:penicillin-binding protein 2 [Patescibacteria group bacterium]